MPSNPDKTRLTNRIRRMLPDAEMAVTSLPLCPDLKLYLLRGNNMKRCFSQEETRSILSLTPYWAFCWASGHALASYILRNRAYFKNKCVLDFGAGSGVLAVAAAMAGASKAIACDTDPHAISAVKANAALNGQQVVTCKTLKQSAWKADILLAADVLYDRENLPYLKIFFDYANEVLIADSRLKTIPMPEYGKIDEIRTATLPDLHESEEFNHVRIYRACGVT